MISSNTEVSNVIVKVQDGKFVAILPDGTTSDVTIDPTGRITRPNFCNFRLSDEEHQLIVSRANEQDMSVSDWARKKLLQ